MNNKEFKKLLGSHFREISEEAARLIRDRKMTLNEALARAAKNVARRIREVAVIERKERHETT